ncbi:NERD domain-containing protein [Paenibacillus sp. strain BS8-2]
MVYLLAGLFLILFIISKSPKLKGMIGEFSIRAKLKRLNPNEYTVLHDIMIKQSDGKTAQIDHLVVSRYGVFVIETKNYTGWIVGNEKSEYWTQVIYKRKEKLYNPIRQNYGHIKALENVLEDDSIPFISIIAFSTRANLKLEQMSTEVVYSTQLVSTINKYKVELLADEHKRNILKVLSSKLIKGNKERKQHVKDIKGKLRTDRAMTDSGICPRCGNRLMKRNGKNGSFLGCNSYPRCRFTSKA